LQHMCIAIATTYICNIPIYFCNIHIKHLQHTSETLKTSACNMRFQAQHLLAIGMKWKLVDTELNADTEIDVVEWCVEGDANG
jgi:hypothetical protein